MTTQSLKIKT